MPNSTVVINTVARRLRDNANLAYPRAVLQRYVDHSQRVINAHTKSFLAIATPSGASFHTFSSVYRISTLLGASAASIELVQEYQGGANSANAHGKTIERVDWGSLIHQDPRWFQRSGPALVGWATVGKDLLILYPVLTRPIVTGDIQITYVPSVPSQILDNNTNDMVIADDLVPILQDLCEVLGCYKGRRFSEAADPAARLQQHLSSLGISFEVQDLMGRA